MAHVPDKFVVKPGIPNGFKVITIGSGSPGQDLRKLSPCTLVQYKDKYFACDLGNGAMNKMLECGIDPTKVRNVCFTHLHADHSADYPYFLIIGWHDGRNELNLFGPPKTQRFHDIVVDELYGDYVKYLNMLGLNLDGLKTNVNIREIEDVDKFEKDGVTISTLHVPHTAYTIAYKFEAGGERVVVSGDMTYFEPFIEFAKDADILVMDANQTPAWHLESMGAGFAKNLEKSHIRIPELAQMAEKARVKKLVLTHMTRGTYLAQLVQQISAGYTGDIALAFDGQEIFPGVTTGY